MKNKLIWLLMFCSIIVILLFCKVIIRNHSRYLPNVSSGIDIPSGMVWNSHLGIYYDPQKYEIDDRINMLIVKPSELSSSSNGVIIADIKELWFSQNKNTKDPIDKLIIEYLNKKRSTTSTDDVFKSYYMADEDKFLYLLTDIDVKSIPFIISKVKNNHPYLGLLMIAAEKIMKIKSTQVISVSEDGIEEWLDSLKEKIYTAPEIVEKCSYQLNHQKDLDVDGQVKNKLQSIGIFSLPYAMECNQITRERLFSIIYEITNKPYLDEDMRGIKSIIDQLKAILE